MCSTIRSKFRPFGQEQGSVSIRTAPPCCWIPEELEDRRLLCVLNTPPVVMDDAYSVDEDTTLTVSVETGVLANDTDLDDNSLTAVLVSGPSDGSLTLSTDGSFTYTPEANFNGTDTFTYLANDGCDDSLLPATVTITINAVNDAPTVSDDSYSVDEDNTLIVAAPGVLDNDSDVEGDAISAALVGGPSNGTLTLNSDGSFTYTPDADFHGSDSFTYRASDGSENSTAATVTITVNAVNDTPAASGDSYSVDEDNTLTVSAAGGLLTNDTDVDDDILSVVLVSGVSHGTLMLNADGSLTYTPNVDFYGSDSFTYQASDGSASSSPATVNIVVNALSDPVVVRDGNVWHLRSTLSTGVAGTTFVYGLPEDVHHFMGDWDGDGVKTPGIFRDGVFYLRNNNSTGFADIVFGYGLAGDTPVIGDWDGDGVDTMGVVRGGQWFLRNSNTTGVAEVVCSYGLAGDTPVVGDWDGDGADTIGVVRHGKWFLRNSNTTGAGEIVFGYGLSGDASIVGDWDGDGDDTPGVVRGGQWHLRHSIDAGAADIVFTFGLLEDDPFVW